MLSDFNLSSISPGFPTISRDVAGHFGEDLADGWRLSVQRSFALTFPT